MTSTRSPAEHVFRDRFNSGSPNGTYNDMMNTSATRLQSQSPMPNGATSVVDGSPMPTVISIRSITNDNANGLINNFYQRFYPAHPILVPRPFFASQNYPDYLQLVVCFIGQQYHTTQALANDQSCGRLATDLYNLVCVAMSEPNDEVSICRVQALLLFSIALHGRHQIKEAELTLARAARIALTLGMNRPDFAREASSPDSKREQSIRRTWWELYITDAYVAALHQRLMFTGTNIAPVPLLPCAQSDFELSNVEAPPVSLDTFNARVFADDAVTYPSYCYRIEAARIVERVLQISTTENTDSDDIQNVDNSIASWKYHLPNHSDTVVDASGAVDPLLFQAHYMIHCATIFLHFPRCELPHTIPSIGDIACARGRRPLAPTSSHHTIKTINASKEISDLASIPGQLDQHSPFFACGLILSCIVQMAAASTHLHSCGPKCLHQHRDRVILILGVLKRLSQTWPVARTAVQRLRTVANNIFLANETRTEYIPEAASSSADDSALDMGEFPESLSWFDLLGTSGFEISSSSFQPISS
jgi:hypothetical protein